jgi:hypothetical protein
VFVHPRVKTTTEKGVRSALPVQSGACRSDSRSSRPLARCYEWAASSASRGTRRSARRGWGALLRLPLRALIPSQPNQQRAILARPEGRSRRRREHQSHTVRAGRTGVQRGSAPQRSQRFAAGRVSTRGAGASVGAGGCTHTMVEGNGIELPSATSVRSARVPLSASLGTVGQR